MECLPLFAQCCVTAGMQVYVLVAGAGLQASQESQGGYPPLSHSSIQSPSQPPAVKPR